MVVGYITTNHLVFGVAFGLLIITLKQNSYQVIVNRVTIFMGGISYSMYILHFGVIFWFDKLHTLNFIGVHNSSSAIINLLIRYIAVVIVTAILSFASNKLVELPFQQLGLRLISRLKASER